MNSEKLYHDFEAAFQDAKQQLDPYLPSRADFRLTFWAGYGNKPYFDMEVSAYPESEKVRGIHLQEMVDELARRLDFVKRQSTLQLSAPVIDLTPEVTEVTEETSCDEVPF